MYIEEISIYETCNAGAVTRVAAMDTNGQYVTLWEVSDEGPTVIQSSRIFKPELTVRNMRNLFNSAARKNMLAFMRIYE